MTPERHEEKRVDRSENDDGKKSEVTDARCRLFELASEFKAITGWETQTRVQSRFRAAHSSGEVCALHVRGQHGDALHVLAPDHAWAKIEAGPRHLSECDLTSIRCVHWKRGELIAVLTQPFWITHHDPR